MKTNALTNFEIEQYKKNIPKFYIQASLKNFLFFSAILVPFFTEWGKISFSQIMVLQAIFTVSIFLFEIPTGVIADYFSRKKSMILGGMASALGFLIYASYANFWLFALGEFIIAIGSTLASGADQAILYDTLKLLKRENESKKIITKAHNFKLISGGIAAALGGVFAKIFGLQATMLFSVLPILVATFVISTIKEPKVEEKVERESYLKFLKKGIKYFKEHRAIKQITFNYVPVAAMAFFLVWVYQVILRELNFDLSLFGVVHSTIFLSEFLLLHNLEKVEKFFRGKENYLFGSALLIGVGFIALSFTKSYFIAIPIILILAAFGLTRKPIYTNYLNKHIESHNRATVLSIISMILGLAQAISNLIFGKIVDVNLSLALLILGMSIIFFAIISKVEGPLLKD